MTGRRRYHSPRRAEQAAATRRAVLAAARELFVAQGYLGTTVADVARRARVAVDTVYATVGRKPALLREVLETALSGTDQEVPARQREYVARVRAAPRRGRRSRSTPRPSSRSRPGSPRSSSPCATRRRATRAPQPSGSGSAAAVRRTCATFAADLRATGELRADLSDDEVADVVWSMNGPEYWVLLVGDRGWSPERFGAFLADAWTRLLTSGSPYGERRAGRLLPQGLVTSRPAIESPPRVTC